MISQATAVPPLLKDQRRHPRAQLHLPVQLRWLALLSQLTETTETLDVSRGGLLFYRREPCTVRARLWVTFPFDLTSPLAQPEMPARVVRVKSTPAGGHLVAVEFEAPLQHATGGAAPSFERRGQERIRLALPIRIRPADSPWPEETMSVDFSDRSMLFSTARLYDAGDLVRITLPYGRWASAGEVPARVVRSTRRTDSVEQHVAVVFQPRENP